MAIPANMPKPLADFVRVNKGAYLNWHPPVVSGRWRKWNAIRQEAYGAVTHFSVWHSKKNKSVTLEVEGLEKSPLVLRRMEEDLESVSVSHILAVPRDSIKHEIEYLVANHCVPSRLSYVRERLLEIANSLG